MALLGSWEAEAISSWNFGTRHTQFLLSQASGRNRWPSLPRSTRAFRPHARVRQRSLARQGASWPNRATVPAAQRLRRGRRLRSFRHSLSTVRRERCALCNECFRPPVRPFRRNREEHLDFLAGHHVLATDEVHSALGKIHCLAFYHAKVSVSPPAARAESVKRTAGSVGACPFCTTRNRTGTKHSFRGDTRRSWLDLGLLLCQL